MLYVHIMMWFKRRKDVSRGQSLVELLIGIAIVAIITSSVVGAIMLSVRINKQSIATKVASSLGQETLDDLRSISEGRWRVGYDERYTICVRHNRRDAD